MSITDVLMNTASRFVPMATLIRGAHLYNKVAHALRLTPARPVFVEEPLPEVSTLSLAEIDVSNPFLFRQDKWLSYFRRLRDECPVHYRADSPFGPFWSITRFDDIVYVDTHPELFSAEPLIVLGKEPAGMEIETFIAMDPPRHAQRRQSVQGAVAPQNLKQMESLIRERTREVLDHLPTNEPFDWVEKVSVELTTRMLATLLDFPFEDRHLLAKWTNVAVHAPESTGGVADNDEFFGHATELVEYMSRLFREKLARKEAGESLGFDLVSMMVSSDDTKDMLQRPREFLGNFVLLIVGGNDTTRHSMTGGVHALHHFPEELEKLKANPKLIPNMVSEIIRWQTPLAYMRRVATQDVELNGQTIKEGDKVVMWYASGNRDERKIADPDRFMVDRPNARTHLSFGFGIHRCMGNRLAELQLRILWEEILERFRSIEVVEEPRRVQSNFVKGYLDMMVKVVPRSA